ncbi:MAG: enoyl-CoA hydratase/carnithine racemase [Oleiphilaceae bacterium]|jgi:enoyl-CoA hydratase/carnithine racemase
MPIHYDTQDGVATFTIDNGRLNLFTMAMHESFHRYYLQFMHDDSIKVGVITGHGNNFCAGADLNESDTEIKARSKPRWDEMTLSYARAKPMISAVEGYCFGEGLLYLMLLTDIRIADENLIIGAPEIAYGMGGMSGATHMGSQIPYVQAAYLVLTGEKLTADKALKMNLVNEVVPVNQSLVRAQEIARKIASHPLISVKTEMDCLLRSTELSRLDSLNHTMKQYMTQRQFHLVNGVNALSDFDKTTQSTGEEK